MSQLAILLALFFLDDLSDFLCISLEELLNNRYVVAVVFELRLLVGIDQLVLQFLDAYLLAVDDLVCLDVVGLVHLEVLEQVREVIDRGVNQRI